ncbi:MAG: DUF488 domain-containing protein [Planctomycetota bacterium]
MTRPKTTVAVKRVYDEPTDEDGLRVLVDRVWPRGMTKEAAAYDSWIKELAPSTELRRWFAHDPSKLEDFRERYFAELEEKEGLVEQCLRQWEGRHITLLYGAKDREHNQAVALAEYLKTRVLVGRRSI